MKKIVLAAGIFVALAAAVFCAGCVGSDPVVGTWKVAYDIPGIDLGSAAVTFNADGTGTTEGTLILFTAATSFTWKQVSEGTYLITAGDESKEIAVSFSGDKKTMTFDNVDFVRKA